MKKIIFVFHVLKYDYIRPYNYFVIYILIHKLINKV